MTDDVVLQKHLESLATRAKIFALQVGGASYADSGGDFSAFQNELGAVFGTSAVSTAGFNEQLDEIFTDETDNTGFNSQLGAVFGTSAVSTAGFNEQLDEIFN